jgi:holo-[acyl-carrier protein] synthase
MLRVGFDLVEVQAVEEAVRRYGDRYLGRIFTPAEIATCRTADGLSCERLAARFAAKEATVKVLRVDADTPVSLRSIELVKEPGGWLRIRLDGTAAAAAARERMHDFAVSVSHERGFAGAVVVAFATDDS